MALKILQLTNRVPYPLNDGGNIAVFNLAKQFQNLGCTVDLACLNTNKHFVLVENIQPFYQAVYSIFINTDLTLLGILKGFFEELPYNITRFKSIEFESLLENILSKNEYDYIFIEGSYMGLYIDLLRKHSKAKILLRSHNVEYTIWERLASSLKNPIKKFYIQTLIHKIKRFEIETIPKYDIIVPISDVDKVFYEKNGADNCITICAGVNIEVITQKYLDSNRSICFIGSMEWMPNLQGVNWFLENVWPIIQSKNPNCIFHIAGKGMGNKLNHWRNCEGVVLHGEVIDAKEFVENNGIFIVPLLSGGGVRLKIIEAMALKRPIVSTSVGAEGIELTHEKNYILADSAEDFANRILYLLSNNNLAKELGEAAYTKVKESYNWSALAEQLYKFLKNYQ